MLRLIVSVVLAAPILFACLALLVLAVLTLKKHPVQSALAIASLGSFVLLRFIIPNVLSIDQMISLNPWLTVLSCVTWILLLIAALCGREPVVVASKLPQFQMKHLLLVMLFSAIFVAAFVTFSSVYEAKMYFRNLRGIPHLAIWAVGAIVAVVYFRRQPISSTMILVAVTSLLAVAAMEPIFREWRSYSAGSYVQLQRIADTVRWTHAMFISPVAYLLIVGAIFTERSRQSGIDETSDYVPCEAVASGCC
ncbi:MAG: hypothetical protein KDB27_10270 [Planctomycetales bacterium]|nr:hypothetical protein [Planctomycetales bacterium]